MALRPAIKIDEDTFLIDISPLNEPITFNDDVRLYFGTDQDAYLVWNGTTNRLELWVNGRRRWALG